MRIMDLKKNKKKISCNSWLKLPPNGKINIKRRLVERYKRFLFTNQNSPEQIKTELMKLIKNSNELVDIELLGINLNGSSLYDSCNDDSTNETGNIVLKWTNRGFQCLKFFVLDLNQDQLKNGLTYELLQSYIDDLLVQNNYQSESFRTLRWAWSISFHD